MKSKPKQNKNLKPSKTKIQTKKKNFVPRDLNLSTFWFLFALIEYQTQRGPQGSPVPTFHSKSTEIQQGYSFQSSSNSRKKPNHSKQQQQFWNTQKMHKSPFQTKYWCYEGKPNGLNLSNFITKQMENLRTSNTNQLFLVSNIWTLNNVNCQKTVAAGKRWPFNNNHWSWSILKQVKIG